MSYAACSNPQCRFHAVTVSVEHAMMFAVVTGIPLPLPTSFLRRCNTGPVQRQIVRRVRWKNGINYYYLCEECSEKADKRK
jgi:hypothetical protein